MSHLLSSKEENRPACYLFQLFKTICGHACFNPSTIRSDAKASPLSSDNKKATIDNDGFETISVATPQAKGSESIIVQNVAVIENRTSNLLTL